MSFVVSAIIVLSYGLGSATALNGLERIDTKTLSTDELAFPLEVKDASILAIDSQGRLSKKVERAASQSTPQTLVRKQPSQFVDTSEPAVTPPAQGPTFSSTHIIFFAGLLGIVAASSWLGITHAPGSMAALFYLCISIAIDACISLSHSRAGSTLTSPKTFAFNPLCNIILVEFGKLLVSIALFAKANAAPKLHVFASIVRATEVSDIGFMGIPAVCYTLNNMLVYLAIGNNEISTFAAFRETMVLWTALIWTMVFRVPLGWRRIAAIFTIVFGLVLNQVAPLMHASFSWAILLVCAMASANALGSVCNEYALKRTSDADLNLQNIHLYTWCLSLAFLLLAATDPKQLLSLGSFVHGFDAFSCTIIVLQLTAGLLVSRILKYASSLQKTMVSALRGPILVVVGPLLMLPSRTDSLTLLSAFIVGGSAAYFLMQGKPVVE